MKKRLCRLILCVCLVAALLCGIGSAAYAASDYYTVTLQKGDTVFSPGLREGKERNHGPQRDGP